MPTNISSIIGMIFLKENIRSNQSTNVVTKYCLLLDKFKMIGFIINHCVRMYTHEFNRNMFTYSASNIHKISAENMGPSTNVLKRFDNIVKSAEDNRSYRGLEMGNRLKVLLVSDPTTDKSAAALDINIGTL